LPVAALLAAAGAAVPALAVDEFHKSADEVHADAVAALRRIPGARIDGTVVDRVDHTATRVTSVVSASGDARLTARHGKETFQVVVAGPHEYLRGPVAFWRETGFARRESRRLARVWVSVAVGGDRPDETLRPADLAACLEGAHGTLSILGSQRVDGRRAVVLADAGDVPGSAPERIAVLDGDPAMPVRITLTGPRRKGAPASARCDPAETSIAIEDLHLVALSAAPHIAVPRHARTLRQVLGDVADRRRL
jgi:hypothetical protein